MANEKYKEVTKEEFDQFIKDYPNTISWDTCGIFDPPKTMVHDFTLYKGWDLQEQHYRLHRHKESKSNIIIKQALGLILFIAIFTILFLSIMIFQN